MRRFVLERDRYRCQVPADDGELCGAWASCADHIVPKSRGGSDHPDNLRAACTPCNLRRGDRLDGEPRGRVVVRRQPTWSW